jgi:hypothetical protein
MCSALVIGKALWSKTPMIFKTNTLSAFRRSTLALILIAGSAIPALAAETPSTVVELFTSQGCSSCPPANEFVGQLSDDEDVLVLTYGVTYWDYLGWKDTFAQPDFTARQRSYGQAFGIGNVYTPQIVLNGSAHSPRYSESDVKTMPLRASGVAVKLGVVDGQLVLDADHDAVIVGFKSGWQDVPVDAGENHGRTLRLANVVKSLTPVKAGSGITHAAEDGLSYAALVHDPVTMKVLSASVYTPK